MWQGVEVPNNSDFAHRAVVVWMKDVMRDSGWSPQEWARRAKTTPTNITRVIDPTSKIVPGLATIHKLAMVAGSQPNLVPQNPAPRDPQPQVAAAPAVCFCPFCGHDIRLAPSSADEQQTMDKSKLWTWSPTG